MSYGQRRYDPVKVQAELAGDTEYAGKPCSRNPDHIAPDGTSLRDTTRAECMLCRKAYEVARGRLKRLSQAQTKARENDLDER